MTLIDQASDLLQAGARLLYNTDVEVVKGTYVDSGLDKGLINWDNPTKVGQTFKASKQPAGERVQRNAGLDTKQGRWQIFCDPVTLTPDTHRLKIGDAYFEILAHDAHPSHAELVIEEVA